LAEALEGAFHDGAVPEGQGRTALIIDEHHRPQVVAGLLTGLHVPGESHFRLLRSLADEAALAEAGGLARAQGLVPHERGDAALLWAARFEGTFSPPGPSRAALAPRPGGAGP
jgi:S-adenosylmethionine:tRNA ribosyltransferase-isomerase